METPDFIHFRALPAGPSQLFQPRQFCTISFTNGRCFRYGDLTLNHAAEIQLEKLPRGYFTDMDTDSLLAEVLLEGPAELLRVVRDGIVYYLICRAGQPYLELSEREYLRETPLGGWVITDRNNYLAQLGVYFGDCPAAAAIAGKTLYCLWHGGRAASL